MIPIKGYTLHPCCQCGGVPEIKAWHSNHTRWSLNLYRVECSRCGNKTEESANERLTVAWWNAHQEHEMNQPPKCGGSRRLQRRINIQFALVAVVVGVAVAGVVWVLRGLNDF